MIPWDKNNLCNKSTKWTRFSSKRLYHLLYYYLKSIIIRDQLNNDAMKCKTFSIIRISQQGYYKRGNVLINENFSMMRLKNGKHFY